MNINLMGGGEERQTERGERERRNTQHTGESQLSAHLFRPHPQRCTEQTALWLFPSNAACDSITSPQSSTALIHLEMVVLHGIFIVDGLGYRL